MGRVLLLGTGADPVRTLAAGLDAELVELPPVQGEDLEWSWATSLETWRSDASSGPKATHVVVAVWAEEVTAGTVDEMDEATWVRRAEQPIAQWVTALGAAVTRCADGGTIVAVLERPSPLDCAGWAPESGTADAVEALIRSLARSEGPRGIRVNAVTTPTRLTGPDVVAPVPPLDSFPGTVERDVVGAVRLLLDSNGSGLTGTVTHADAGRSWR